MSRDHSHRIPVKLHQPNLCIPGFTRKCRNFSHLATFLTIPQSLGSPKSRTHEQIVYQQYAL